LIVVLSYFAFCFKEPPMKAWAGWISVLVVAILLHQDSTAVATPPWMSLLPFKRIDADPDRSYELTEEHGPWLILAASFADAGCEEQARDLVLELRKRYRLPAYIHRKEYDFTEPVQGRTINRYGEWARMVHAKAGRYEALAVLVGDFESLDDSNLEKTLEKIRYARPDCLELTPGKRSSQRFAALRELYRRANGNETKRNKGPMGHAFATPNPLVPPNYFAPQGIDDFVQSLNRGVKYSLLDNSGKYTVRVATFRGNETINQKEIQELQRDGRVSNKLELAADRAHRLTMALRAEGIEAYEFHDRHESIVTIGSFQSEGTPLSDGSIEINPAIHSIMKQYGAAQAPIAGRQELGLQPRAINGIAFDIQPMPIRVPRRSIAMDYLPGRSIFR
jgi:hypothetical protein